MDLNFQFPILRFTQKEWNELTEKTKQELVRGRFPYMLILEGGKNKEDTPST